jgi:hypothetical protein
MPKGKFLVPKCLLVFSFAMFLQASRTQAQGSTIPPAFITYLSNSGEPFGGSVLYGNDSWIAQSFETGAASGGYVLTGPTGISGTAAPPSELSFYSDNNGVPGVELGSDGITLSPSTIYWFVATASEPAQGSGQINVFPKSWNYASDANYASSDGWTVNATFATSSNGANWLADANHAPFEFTISGSPVPEPEISVLTGLGLAMMALQWKKFPRMAKH